MYVLYIYVYSVSSSYLLVFGMIMYSVYVSRWCCRWIWWGIKPERG